MKMKELLKELSEATGVSGAEGGVRDIIMRELKGQKPSVMLTAHTDEIGLIVKFIDEKGYLKFAKVGGIDDRTLVSRRIIIHGKNKVTGIIGARPPHLLEADEMKKVTTHKEMFIDIGAKDRKEAEKLVDL
jgi:putative aminopeptidase FrvX